MRLAGRFRRRGAVAPAGLPDRPTLIGARGANLSGVRPDGTAIDVAVTEGTSALLFLTGSCHGCQVLWQGASASGANAPAPLPVLPLVIVTPSPTTEDARVVAGLAPEAGIPVVMSSEGWHAYRVARAPWYVGVAAGVVVADGLAPETWSGLVAEVTRLTGSGPSGAAAS
jgi:hypothetical protein